MPIPFIIVHLILYVADHTVVCNKATLYTNLLKKQVTWLLLIINIIIIIL